MTDEFDLNSHSDELREWFLSNGGTVEDLRVLIYDGGLAQILPILRGYAEVVLTCRLKLVSSAAFQKTSEIFSAKERFARHPEIQFASVTLQDLVFERWWQDRRTDGQESSVLLPTDQIFNRRGN